MFSVYGVALGYEDLNDHDDLRHDPLLATLVGKVDPTGQDRQRERDRGKPLAGKSTLNRLELTLPDADRESRYKKIVINEDAVDRFFIDTFLQAHPEPPERIVIDFDATDDPLHGNQEGRFFHGYYREYCYLPLYIFCGEFLLCARLRSSNIDAAAGSVEELQRIVCRIRAQWPDVKIVIRADSGFARDAIMTWCESNHVDYILGLAKNERLKREIAEELEEARKEHEQTEKAAVFIRTFAIRLSTAGRENVASSLRRNTFGKAPIRVLSSRRSLQRRSTRRLFTRRSIAPAATWKTASKNSSSISSPIERAPHSCVQTRFGSGCPLSPTPYFKRCVAWASQERSSRTLSVERSVSNS